MRYVLLFDGGCNPNPGIGYGSYQVTDHNGEKHIFRLKFGPKETNNTAEWKSLIAGMEAILCQIIEDGNNPSRCELLVVGDSRMVLKQLSGEWKSKFPHLRELYTEGRKLAQQFVAVDVKWQPRDKTVAILGH